MDSKVYNFIFFRIQNLRWLQQSHGQDESWVHRNWDHCAFKLLKGYYLYDCHLKRFLQFRSQSINTIVLIRFRFHPAKDNWINGRGTLLAGAPSNTENDSEGK